jgi:small-conductance mechanosensitive channel
MPGSVVVAQFKLREYTPEWMNETYFAGLSLAQWVGLAGCVALAYVVGLAMQLLITRGAPLVTRRTKAAWDDSLLALLPGPLRLFLTLFVLAQLLPQLELNVEAHNFLQSLLSGGVIVAVIWLLLRLLQLGGRMLIGYRIRGAEDTPQARAIRTQVSVIQTVVRFLLILAAVALVLMQFEVARGIGVSLLASAGIAGIAIGFAAQRTVSTLFAGIQLAFTRVIKIGDSVVVEGQFGTIEDIRLTFVVVKIWDLRRLILPVTYFVEKPIENWTATTTDLLGTVFVYTDYTVPVDEIRDELKKSLEETDLWDGKVQGVQVTNLTERFAEVRILVSAADGGKLFNLRCLIRERLLTWLQGRGRGHLPIYRIEMEGLPVNGGK